MMGPAIVRDVPELVRVDSDREEASPAWIGLRTGGAAEGTIVDGDVGGGS